MIDYWAFMLGAVSGIGVTLFAVSMIFSWLIHYAKIKEGDKWRDVKREDLNFLNREK